MAEKMKKKPRFFLVVLIVICIGIIVYGGVRYLQKLQDNLANAAIQDVMNVTMQQRQSFDGFISRDRDRLHGYAEYFSKTDISGPKEVQKLLTTLNGVDANCIVMSFDGGWACSSTYDNILQMSGEELNAYQSLSDNGVRNSFVGMFSGVTKFGYYETFTFSNGHKGLIEKAYDRNKLLETFTLSLYDGQGFGYILEQNGDILLRSVVMPEGRGYENVFDALTDIQSPQEDIDNFRNAMGSRESGSIVFDGENGQYVYTYTPLNSVDDWYLLSVVPVDEIRAEGDAILHDTETTLSLFIVILVLCAVFALLIWNTHKDIVTRDQKIAYQTEQFNVFTTYLSCSTDDMYIMQDQETGEVDYISPNVERVLGVKAEELIEYLRKSDMDADPEGAEKSYEQLKALKPGEAASPRYAERINPRTGERKYFLESDYCASVQGRSKLVCYISDRTKEQKSKNDLSQALKMAQAANEAKSAFLGSVSHDIRTPMNAIIGFLTLMRNEVDNPGMVLEYTQRIDAASQHLLGLINDVLDMNKIESGSTTLSIDGLNIAEVIEEINNIIRPQAKGKGQSFEINVPHLENEYLMGDKVRINQILINLLSNAVKYTPEGGTIEMKVTELPQVVNNYSRIRFTVRDNGIGMSEEYQKVIFDPFTREETKATREIQGTGLGMAITKSLVDLMGGTIGVESSPGKGSEFTVELELRIQEERVRENDIKFWKEHGLRKLLVVESDEQTWANISKAMAKTGVQTERSTAAASGEGYDLILLDWEEGGAETARALRERSGAPILALTGTDWVEIEREAREAGVNRYIAKPFFASTFKEAVRGMTGSGETEKEEGAEILRGKRVLVADDIDVNRLILTKILGTLGAECDSAENGAEAVEKFRTGEYDLILMDIQMPELDGHGATRAIRSSGHPRAKEIPIIAMTANAFVEDVREAIESGMDAHIAKPVQVDVLKGTIGEVFARRGI